MAQKLLSIEHEETPLPPHLFPGTGGGVIFPGMHETRHRDTLTFHLFKFGSWGNMLNNAFFPFVFGHKGAHGDGVGGENVLYDRIESILRSASVISGP